ncbi:hypothetical protein MU0083_002865 [[Mycobacterium] kokjensenii]|uniref:Uncharacterized protein n=1 Tax=[Mycobacterium] kokjensenii TaxID=3064287 RepID=A0ABN9NBX4_9MYCO|nr:hypothetical protein [Mycolicibacter sp. MU0083]CAJ1502165.1 hypothetical protein MU0083_002865 [Mycolicibacter sp. MU0083]
MPAQTFRTELRAAPLPADKDLRPRGTNGYTTSWGNNAHGKLAGCPPARR